MGKRAASLGCALVVVGCSLPRGTLGPSGGSPDGASFDAAVPADDAFTIDDTSVPTPDAYRPDAGHDVCGDGHLGLASSGETCDDHNTTPGDGCDASCHLEPGFTCTGSPSVCTTMCGDGIRAGTEVCDGVPGCTACMRDTMQSVMHGPGLALTIPDDAYNGMLTSMTCVDLAVVQYPLDHVASVELEVGMSHTYIADLTIKLVSPMGTVVTLMSRPGRIETADDGSDGMGDASDLAATNPITFVTGAATSAENMGNTINGGVVCRDDSICSFAPDHGASTGGDLTMFAGETAHGTWHFCAADGAPRDTGSIDRVTLRLTLN